MPSAPLRLSTALLLLVGHPGVRVAAQAPPVRDSLRLFRTEIALIADTVALKRLDRRLGEAGGDPDAEAMRRMRRGIVRLRIGELGDGWSYGRAAADFDRAATLRPSWTEAWEARGVAQHSEGRWQAANPMNIGKRVGLGSIQDAVQSFVRAIAADSTNTAAGRALFDAALELRDTATFRATALPALRQLGETGRADTGLLLALGRAERLMGDSLAAMGAARAYLAGGGTRGLALREIAWNGFLAGDSASDSAYYAGVADEDSAGMAAFREDLALIADSAELLELDQLRGAPRAAWLRAFWTDRALRELRSPAERLAEHYRRLTFAERNFGLEVNRRHYAIKWTDMYRSGSTRFDDRGIVYVRHGPPDQRAATVTFDIMPNETWRYDRADGDLLLHFAANPGGDIRDYRLIPSLADVEGVEIRDADKAATWFAFEDRCPLYAPYCKALAWGAFGRKRIMEEERALVTTSAAIAVTSDAEELHFSRRLEAAARAFAVGRTTTGQLVHLVYQVTLQAPGDSSSQAMFTLPLRVRAALFDREGRVGGWIDTTTTVLLAGSDVSGGTIDAVGRVTVVMPAGTWHYRTALSTADSTGLVLPSDSVIVPVFGAGRLAVSDLVLSKSGRGARWVPAEGDTAYFNPRRTWLRSDTIALYHEIYGLSGGAAYSAKLTVRKGRRVAMALRWEGQAAGETARVSRTLSFGTVPPGDYELELEVRDPSGRTARSARRIRVTD
jgi:GWxTD domain-containing protein